MESGGIRHFSGKAPAPRTKAWADTVALMAPALLLAFITLPYRYDLTLAEPDLARMMAALVYGNATGANEAA